jgi:pimeloyl-ACP methyl ester carboxylesterase
MIDAPRGTPLVLSNGAACTIQYWPLLVDYFAGRVPIVLWDYRGHGRSGRAPHETYDIPCFGRDLTAVLDAAGIERAVLIGHSMGVQVILEAYRRAAERVAGLVPMFGSFGEISTAFSTLPLVPALADGALALLERHAERVWPLLRPAVGAAPGVLFARLVGSNLALCPPEYLRALMRHVATLEPGLIVRVFRAVLRYNAADLLPTIDVPTLVFAGAADRMTPASLAERMARAIPGADLALVDHGSHLAMLENPGFVHCRLELFLRDHGFLLP